MEQRRLYRSEEDRLLAGVCGGLGAYLGVDPTIVRLVFVLLGVLSGVGIVVYLVMWVIVPSQSRLDAPPPEVAREGVADMKERARQGVEEARGALDRLRGKPADEGEPPAAAEPQAPPAAPERQAPPEPPAAAEPQAPPEPPPAPEPPEDGGRP